MNTINATVLKSKPYVTVFVSHAHRDHFNPMILRWRVRRPDIQYIFSDDIPELDNVIRMRSRRSDRNKQYEYYSITKY